MWLWTPRYHIPDDKWWWWWWWWLSCLLPIEAGSHCWKIWHEGLELSFFHAPWLQWVLDRRKFLLVHQRHCHLKSRWESTLKYNITILTCPWPSSYWSPWSWWTSTFDIARFTSAKYVTLIMKSLDRWKITKTLKMRTNKPVVAPKRLPQNEGEVSHWLSAHQERWDPGRSTGRSAAPRSPPRWTPERGSHTHSHEENFQCRSGC